MRAPAIRVRDADREARPVSLDKASILHGKGLAPYQRERSPS